MPITVRNSPSAAAVGSAGFLGGRGDYERYLRQQAQRELENQQRVQLELRQQNIGENNALRSLFAQQASQAAQLQAAAQRQRVDAQVGQQRQVVGAGLDARRMQQQAYLGNIGAQQDQSRRMELMQFQNELQNNPLADRSKISENMALLKQLPQARSAWEQENQPMLDQGMQLTPEDQKRFTKLSGDLEFLTREKRSGRLTDADFLTGGRKLYYEMMGIRPSQKPPSPEEQVKQRVTWIPNPQTGQMEGVVIDRYGVPK